ncbi:MAG: DNA/RNA nuclease SfsA [Firmicutes bacterium]|nr:DNA/RNA nuclease SfsA [Bacillota bacterium]
MIYENITKAKFICRPNRFIADVYIGEKRERVHVKNTGRCKELLIEGSTVYLTAPESKGRKTKYDLVAVEKNNGLLVNIDSQAPNKVVRQWLENKGFDNIVPEYTYGSSRIDFYMEKEEKRYLSEVKGCTLEVDGIGYFPDAPTERGVKHIKELIKAQSEGYIASLIFAVQMDGIKEVLPNAKTHPEFAKVFKLAKEAGVHIYALPCHIEPQSVTPAEDIIAL